MSARSLVGALVRYARARLLRSPGLFLRLFTPTDPELGELGEEIAARHLHRNGWRVVGRRVRTPRGEIDLLARDRNRLVCVEVKTGRVEPVPRPRGARVVTAPELDLRWRPGGRFGAARLARLKSVARALGADPKLAKLGPARVDLVEVLVDLRARRVRVIHHPDLRRPLA